MDCGFHQIKINQLFWQVKFIFLLIGIITSSYSHAQPNSCIALISDTQAPLWIEKIFLKSHHNEEATDQLFDELENIRPTTLLLLGDVTAWSAREKRWKIMDRHLQRCRAAGIKVHALLGNHDVMGNPKRGMRHFQKRFPDEVPTGFLIIQDSMAFVLLNSNFERMTEVDIRVEQQWYQQTLNQLETDSSVKAVIVTCHHAPFTNSKIVHSSIAVQQRFVQPFLQKSKTKLFITGHAHAFEHFINGGKDFLVIGGGGGIHQPLGTSLPDLQADFKPMFHFLSITRNKSHFLLESHFLNGASSKMEVRQILSLESN